MDLPNSMVWILPESMDLPDILNHKYTIIQLLWKIKIHRASNDKSILYNFHTINFQFFSDVHSSAKTLTYIYNFCFQSVK